MRRNLPIQLLSRSFLHEDHCRFITQKWVFLFGICSLHLIPPIPKISRARQGRRAHHHRGARARTLRPVPARSSHRAQSAQHSTALCCPAASRARPARALRPAHGSTARRATVPRQHHCQYFSGCRAPPARLPPWPNGRALRSPSRRPRERAPSVAGRRVDRCKHPLQRASAFTAEGPAKPTVTRVQGRPLHRRITPPGFGGFGQVWRGLGPSPEDGGGTRLLLEMDGGWDVRSDRLDRLQERCTTRTSGKFEGGNVRDACPRRLPIARREEPRAWGARGNRAIPGAGRAWNVQCPTASRCWAGVAARFDQRVRWGGTGGVALVDERHDGARRRISASTCVEVSSSSSPPG
jgi:hypothetical protein